MGTNRHQALLLVGLAIASSVAKADGEAAVFQASTPAAGVELFASRDSDDTDVVKLLGRALVLERDPDNYLGLAVERAWFTPLGQRTRDYRRVYADLGGRAGDKWLWQARLGTDGRTWLGSGNVRAKDWSREIFLEREIVETPRGVDEGIYYTFLGASVDVPVTRTDTLAVTAAIQDFTGRNERYHLRGSYVYLVKPELGLSAQLRARYFYSSAPGEFDYYSPRDFFQILPVVQMRRFTSSGWMVLGAAGYGAQRATGGGWESARLAELRFESPRGDRRVRAFGHLQYSNNSLNGSGDYHYVMARFGLTGAF